MYVSMYVCIFVCMYVCLYVYNVCMYVCMYVCMHVCIYACMYACMYICMMYVCRYVPTYICVYIHSLLPVHPARLRSHPLSPWFDGECHSLRRQARRLERVFQRTRLPDERASWILFVRSMYRRYREKEGEYWEHKISSSEEDGFGPLSRISLVGLGLPAHKRLLSRLKNSSITARPRSLPSARTRLNRRNQPSYLQHLALLSSPRSTTWTFVASSSPLPL